MLNLVESLQGNPKVLTQNLDLIVSGLIRKFYSKGLKNIPGSNQRKQNTREDQANIEEVFRIIGVEAVPFTSELSKLANLAEGASYFSLRRAEFWQTLEQRIVQLLRAEMKMNLIQVSQVLRAFSYTPRFKFQDSTFDLVVEQLL